jgi:hypothetical protein
MDADNEPTFHQGTDGVGHIGLGINSDLFGKIFGK